MVAGLIPTASASSAAHHMATATVVAVVIAEPGHGTRVETFAPKEIIQCNLLLNCGAASRPF